MSIVELKFDRTAFFEAYRQFTREHPELSYREIYEVMRTRIDEFKTLDDSILDAEVID